MGNTASTYIFNVDHSRLSICPFVHFRPKSFTQASCFHFEDEWASDPGAAFQINMVANDKGRKMESKYRFP